MTGTEMGPMTSVDDINGSPPCTERTVSLTWSTRNIVHETRDFAAEFAAVWGLDDWTDLVGDATVHMIGQMVSWARVAADRERWSTATVLSIEAWDATCPEAESDCPANSSAPAGAEVTDGGCGYRVFRSMRLRVHSAMAADSGVINGNDALRDEVADGVRGPRRRDGPCDPNLPDIHCRATNLPKLRYSECSEPQSSAFVHYTVPSTVCDLPLTTAASTHRSPDKPDILMAVLSALFTDRRMEFT
ncbi:hypothetical protein NONI108955_23470 [Nocardia ninae]|uniref:Uncharacterized protein n=1 Tax=Nocardia ninae NBRC 108245 TaxID=1210091 RepID=A0A511MGX1_9NOCA|nr:hypothetical protein [Nocardia ninae]GEM39920.1 hypothetical protein NN4_44390 [Nocardia ninae NBRC 108245]